MKTVKSVGRAHSRDLEASTTQLRAAISQARSRVFKSPCWTVNTIRSVCTAASSVDLQDALVHNSRACARSQAMCWTAVYMRGTSACDVGTGLRTEHRTCHAPRRALSTSASMFVRHDSKD